MLGFTLLPSMYCCCQTNDKGCIFQDTSNIDDSLAIICDSMKIDSLRKDSIYNDSIRIVTFKDKEYTYSILGDSYSTFSGYVTPITNKSFYRKVSKFENNVHDVDSTWWRLLEKELNLKMVVNNSYSGATICNTGYGRNDYKDRSFVTRMTNVGNPDILFIFGGTNDCWASSPIGEFKYSDWNTKDLYKFRPAFSYMIYNLKKQHPDMLIVNICNCDLYGEYNISMAEICKHYGVKNVMLESIDKQKEHPSILGMRQIMIQLKKCLIYKDK